MSTLAWAFFALCGPRPARAEEELTLHWRGAPGCPDTRWARTHVEQRLRRPLVDVARGVHAEVVLTRAGHSHVAQLRTVDPDGSAGERSFRGASCAEVAEAATLVLSLTVSEIAELRADSPANEPAVWQSDDDEAAPFLTPRAFRPRAARAHPFALGAAVFADMGVRDLPAAGPALYAAFEYARIRFSAAMLWLPGGTVDRAANTDARADVSLLAGRAGLCVRVARRAGLGVAGCGHAEFGSERAEGHRLGPGGGKAAALWAGAELGLRLDYTVAQRVEFGLSGGALAVVHRPRFLVLGPEGQNIVLQRSWPVSARLSLEVGVRF